ncbi:MAG TPA: cupredoxin domain-containing protein [Rubricoccaceae bacterium]|jgi:uncharacterized cupredoxin-like copper-binding protein|nr:cupredoxin domain-containing protein [Rubricoccaceae bacterium]
MNKLSILPILLALALPLAACGGAEVETAEPTTETPAPMDEGAATTERNTVDVVLTEYEIDMPASLPSGPTTFSITNSGTMEHNFEVEGQGIEEELAEDLQPGGSATLDLTLQPGTYRVYCPVEDHAEAHGMELQLTVTPDDASAAGTAAR